MLLQPQEAPPAEVEAEAARLILFVDQKPWSAKAQELFGKMRQAMKLENVQTEILFADQMSLADFELATLKAHTVVSFSPTLTTTIQNENLFVTNGPEELLQKPELKKQAWDDLQKVMKFLA